MRLLCTDGPVKSLMGLSLTPEHRRGHGAMYDAVNQGGSTGSCCGARWPGSRFLVLLTAGWCRVGDMSAWPRPDAATSPGRLFCHVYGRGRNKDQLIPEWAYSFVPRRSPAAPRGRGPAGAGRDVAQVTTVQVRQVVRRLVTAAQWRHGDQYVLVVFDAGDDLARLAFLLADMPVEVLCRLPPSTGESHREPTPPMHTHHISALVGRHRPPRSGTTT